MSISNLGPPRGKVNALVLNFSAFSDRFAPHIDDIFVLGTAGQRLTAIRKGRLVIPVAGGAVSIVADAWDQVDNNAARRRLGLYRAGFQILKADGTPLRGFEQPHVTLEFDRMPIAPNAAKIVYAPASGDTVHSDQRTRFLYVVSNLVKHGRVAQGGWDQAKLPPGDYTIRIYAADRAGNVASVGRDLPITLN